MNNFIRVIILIVLFIFLVYGLVQVTTVDKTQLEVNETKKIEQFINYNGGEKYIDVLKDLPEIERVFVRVNEKRKSLVEEVASIYKISEDILRLEARKLDYHEWYELHSPDMKI